MDKRIQLGLIAYLSREVGSVNKLGRKAFQKLVHLSNDLAGVPTGYSFSFYIYGPFSRELSSDLELAESSAIISSVQNKVSGAFEINEGPQAKDAEKWAGDHFATYHMKLSALLEKFGKKSAKSLELYSTVVFIENSEPEVRGDPGMMVKRVNALKPKYSDTEIRAAIDYVREFRVSLS
jgi:uncharacterized protein YwgA